MIPVPCLHIAAYYEQRWLAHKCIAFNFLWNGYRQWADGTPLPDNYLYGEKP